MTIAVRSGALILFAISVLPANVFAADDAIRNLRDERVSDVVANEFGCSFTLPFRAQAKDSPSRVGALHTKIASQKVPNGTTISKIDSSGEWCAPSSDVPGGVRGADLKGYRYHRQASAAVKVEAAGIITLLNISAADIREITIDIGDVYHHELNSISRRTVLRDYLANPDCKAVAKDQAARLILGTCTGTVSLGVYFNRGFKIDALKVKLKGLEISASGSWGEEFGEKTACGATAQDKAQNKTIAQEKATDRTISPSTIDKAADAAKKVLETKKAVEDLVAPPKTDPPKDTPTATTKDKSQTPKTDAGTKKESAVANVTADQNCYKLIKLTSPPGAVFGVALSERGAVAKMIKGLKGN